MLEFKKLTTKHSNIIKYFNKKKDIKNTPYLTSVYIGKCSL